jgi:HPt (histidine-containing phosphotransfer) domain-containing protein
MLATDDSTIAAPLELEELLARCVGKIEFAQRVLDRFVASFGDDIDRLERCFHSHELEELARIAHAMKGAAANVAARGLVEQVTRIEDMARSRRLEDFNTCLAQLRDEWVRVSNSVSAIGARGN